MAFYKKYSFNSLIDELQASMKPMPQHIPEEQPAANVSGTPAGTPLFILGQNGPAAMINGPAAVISGTGVWTPIPAEKDWVAEAVAGWANKLNPETETKRKDFELCQLQKRVEQLATGVQHAVSEITKLRSVHLSAEKIPDLVQLTGLLMDRVEFLEDLTKKHEKTLAQNEQLRTENKEQRQQLQALLGRRAKRKVQVPKSAIEENC